MAEVIIPSDGWQDAPRKQVLYQRLWERLHAIPGVQSAALSNILPLGAPFENRFWLAGQPEGREETAPKAGLQTVSADYFATMDIPLLQGRGFTERVAVVNQSAVGRWFDGKSPIGRRIKYRDDGQWQTVVGVSEPRPSGSGLHGIRANSTHTTVQYTPPSPRAASRSTVRANKKRQHVTQSRQARKEEEKKKEGLIDLNVTRRTGETDCGWPSSGPYGFGAMPAGVGL